MDERERIERLARLAYLRARRVVVRKSLHHARSCERKRRKKNGDVIS